MESGKYQFFFYFVLFSIFMSHFKSSAIAHPYPPKGVPRQAAVLISFTFLKGVNLERFLPLSSIRFCTNPIALKMAKTL